MKWGDGMRSVARLAAATAAVGLLLAAPALSGPVQAAGIGLGQHALLAGGNGNGNGNGNGKGNGNGNTVPEAPYAVIFPAAIGVMAWVAYRKKSRMAS